MRREEFTHLLGVKKSYFNRMLLCKAGISDKNKARKFEEITGVDKSIFLYEKGSIIKSELEKRYGVIPETRGGGKK